MTFQEYCTSKKIDGAAFKKGDPEQYTELELLFNEMSAASFTQQKKFLINPIRRRYKLILPELEKTKNTSKKPTVKIPGVKPKVPIDSSPVIKPNINRPKPVIKTPTEGSKKPVLKPKIPGAIKKPALKPVIKPKIPKPVIKQTENSEEQLKPTTLKPKIPGIKKPAALKPKIPKK